MSAAAAELQFVNQHDVVSADTWYLVDAAWLRRWKTYATERGGPPGPISNHALLDPKHQFKQAKPGLVVKEHYRAVGAVVWEYLHARHGGGPAISTDSSMNIYFAHIDDAASPRSPEAQSPRTREKRWKKQNTRISETSTAAPSPGSHVNSGATSYASAGKQRSSDSLASGETPAPQSEAPSNSGKSPFKQLLRSLTSGSRPGKVSTV